MTDPRTNTGNSGFIQSLFDTSFRNLITMRFLRVIYTVILVVSGVATLVWVSTVFTTGGGSVGIVFLVVAAGAWLIYIILVRVSLKVIAVLFEIGDNTARMADAMERRP